MRVALIVPVRCAPDDDESTLLERHRANLAQARALGRAGAEVSLHLDAPFRAVRKLGDGARLEFSPRPTEGAPSWRWPPGRHLLQAARSSRPAVVHTFHLLDVRTQLAMLPLGAKTFAEYNTGWPPTAPWRRRALRVASARHRAVFFTARDMAAPFRRVGALARRTPVVAVPEVSSLLEDPTGSPEAGREARARLGVPTEAQVVLVNAVTGPGKDPLVALEAASIVMRARPRVWLLWLERHRGALHERVRERLSRDPAFTGRSRLVGGLALDEVPPFYAAAEVLLHTSRREAAGFAFLEAMQAGLRIVASDLLPFRALGAGTVRLVPAGDEDRFGEALGAALEDREGGAPARARFRKALSYEAIAGRKLAVYRGEPVPLEY